MAGEPSPQPDQAAAAEGRAARVFHVVRGAPTDAEVVAVIVAVTAIAGAESAGEPAKSLWRKRSRNIRPAVGPSPGAWRASGLPR